MSKVLLFAMMAWTALFIGAGSLVRTACADEMLSVQMRRPVAIAIVKDGDQAITANNRSGTISLLDLQNQKVIQETRVGNNISDLAVTADPTRLLVTDETAHELIAVRLSPSGCRVERRMTVSPYPVSVTVNKEGTNAYVASLWSRTITVVDLTGWLGDHESERQKSVTLIRLPFAPRKQIVVEVSDQLRLIPRLEKPGLKLIVADGFGSKLAVIDPGSGKIDSCREIPAHAIRGMRLHPDKPRVVIAHQMLSRLAHTTFDDVHWGNLLVNCLRSLDLRDLLDPNADLLKNNKLDYLGFPEHGAGDPAEFEFKSNGGIAIAISGTDEMAIDNGFGNAFNRVKVESCPTAVAMTSDGLYALVVNTLSDSVSVVHLSKAETVGTISLGSRPELTDVDRGERLFRSARVSHDNWFSCASCHVDGHTNGLLNDNLTDGSFETAKRILSLRGVGDTAPYAWNGRFGTLSEQITHSVKSTMQGEGLDDLQLSDLEAYLRSLPPPPAIHTQNHVQIERGKRLFERLDCGSCHAPPVYTINRIVDVSLKDERGTTKFNPPSLRGVGQNGPWFHDGRAATLESVFSEFRHRLDHDLTNDELRDLLAFLNSL